MSEKKIKYLVADTTAFINNVQLNNYAENVITIPDVVDEVKNKKQIRRLVVLPFDLHVQEPKADCLAHVTKFAKKTGDFPSLSAIDLKVIALTYELEKEHVGTNHLREEPIVSKVIAAKNKPEVFEDKTPLAGFYNPKRSKGRTNSETGSNISEDHNEENEHNSSEKEVAEQSEQSYQIETKHEIVETKKQEADNVLEESISNSEDKQTVNSNGGDNEEDEEEISEEHLRECFEKLKFGDSQISENDILVPEKKEEAQKHTSDEESNEDDDEEQEDEDDDDDDDSSWITPSNIKQMKEEFKGDSEESSNVTVACMSTDFAIQNVLKQINLNIAALDGRVIKHLRTYILRCYACFKTTSIMTSTFCPNCGNKTLKRVAVSLDENGAQVIHINTRRPLTSKYKNKTLPRFKGGKHSRNPVLFEDQPIPKQMPSRIAKTKTSALDEDYIAGISPFVLRDVDSKSALLRSKGNIKQWARNNEYEEFRRKKQFKLVK